MISCLLEVYVMAGLGTLVCWSRTCVRDRLGVNIANPELAYKLVQAGVTHWPPLHNATRDCIP